MKHLNATRDTLLAAALILMASLCGQSQAQEAEEGKVVVIEAAADVDELVEEDIRIVEKPAHWIGIRGRSIESAVLRTHFQLAEDMGVVVEEVLEGSPAGKAGLRKYDIILRANGDAVDNMQVLQSQVLAGKGKPIELKIIRLGKKETLVVVPEQRPESLSEQARGAEEFGVGNNNPHEWNLGALFGNRNIGPGVVMRGGRQLNLNQMPNGVSVAIQRNNNGPAKISVKKGDQTWQIEGDDKKSLEQLPDDVRPFVERMLHGQNGPQGFGGGGFHFGNINEELQELLPRQFGDQLRRESLQKEREAMQGQIQEHQKKIQLHELELQERMEQLEKRLQELQGKFEEKSSNVQPVEKLRY